jgi:hypothetical protein
VVGSTSSQGRQRRIDRKGDDLFTQSVEQLIVYSTDGQLILSNMLAENAIRPFAVGRRAWLFAYTPAGADASAIHYSLIETAKTHGFEPFAYTVESTEDLLPWDFKKSQPNWLHTHVQ